MKRSYRLASAVVAGALGISALAAVPALAQGSKPTTAATAHKPAAGEKLQRLESRLAQASTKLTKLSDRLTAKNHPTEAAEAKALADRATALGAEVKGLGSHPTKDQVKDVAAKAKTLRADTVAFLKTVRGLLK